MLFQWKSQKTSGRMWSYNALLNSLATWIGKMLSWLLRWFANQPITRQQLRTLWNLTTCWSWKWASDMVCQCQKVADWSEYFHKPQIYWDFHTLTISRFLRELCQKEKKTSSQCQLCEWKCQRSEENGQTGLETWGSSLWFQPQSMKCIKIWLGFGIVLIQTIPITNSDSSFQFRFLTILNSDSF